jgi:hypothetical protein
LETAKLKEKLFISYSKEAYIGSASRSQCNGGSFLKPRQKVIASLVAVILLTLSIQVVAATTECPQCQVTYGEDVMMMNGPSTPNDALTHGGPLSLLDPSAFHSSSQVNIAQVVLKLL